ncbi:aminotransferase class I/II-fold pyridoxal phosphate-dependent enzyme [Zhongshania sp.]|uniref:aminotransferase class I/II-fold pyridoxal phosphate-dependent enzyme n=1 Tax=Zhongshania sp. TaxID=1971902 RepID=UPI001B6FCECF|nr:aminotransferase class I/II-fold pyridoxal phosphate-dependent enzyme [Zhongshania sp.]MBQ0797173.1 aminotransferase class I/II-fold pyridoxal phosphate-dependent enzyme [Zhongshania sp.]
MSDSRYVAPSHGGDPRNIPASASAQPMLDLATGVNPWLWPVPTPPVECYSKLPYFSEALQAAAAAYYGVPAHCLLATAGSQPLIQELPYIAAKGRVLLAKVGYQEHRYRWHLAGHEVRCFDRCGRDTVAEQIRRDAITHLVLISPNNPSAEQVSIDDIRYWRSLLPANGLVVVDQAFADGNPESDVSALAGEPGIVLLRSVGKFFGLPGLRLGFVIAESGLLSELDNRLGPWAVSGTAQWIGGRALADVEWQGQMRSKLAEASLAQKDLLAATFADCGVRCVSSALFITLIMPLARAQRLQAECYQVGLSVRVYQCDDLAYMRWGLASDIEVLAERLGQLNLAELAA